MLTPQPGLEDGDMENYGVPPRGFEKVDFVRVTWVDGGFAGCGASNAEVFGIDRGNDDPGTETDESLFASIKSTKVNEDVFEADFYDEGDFGGNPPTFYEGDELVGKTTGCIDTPDEPGWYQVSSTIASKDGNFEARSHYFYICDCSNEQEAREQLGPPPSEDTPTPTATAESTPTATETAESTPTPEPTPTRTPPEDGTPFPSPTPTATPTATAESTASSGSATAAETATSVGADEDRSGGPDGASDGGDAGGSAAAAGTPSPTPPEDWAAVVQQSPTAAEGPGFGAIAGLAGVLASALLLRRRD
jgi:PGF-CTERM protein